MVPTGNLIGQREAFVARTDAYLRAGYDRLAAARYVSGHVAVPSGLVLDVGTGKGLLARALAKRGLRVTSVDPDPDELALAAWLTEEAGLAARVRLVRADAGRLPYADGTFAAAASMDVLHHLDDPDPCLREMARTVGAGGLVLLADFTEEGFETVSRLHRTEGREHPRSGTSLQQAAAMLEGWGFEPTLHEIGFLHEVAVMTRPRPGG